MIINTVFERRIYGYFIPLRVKRDLVVSGRQQRMDSSLLNNTKG